MRTQGKGAQRTIGTTTGRLWWPLVTLVLSFLQLLHLEPSRSWHWPMLVHVVTPQLNLLVIMCTYMKWISGNVIKLRILSPFRKGRGCIYAFIPIGWKYLLVIKQYSHYMDLILPLTIKIGTPMRVSLNQNEIYTTCGFTSPLKK